MGRGHLALATVIAAAALLPAAASAHDGPDVSWATVVEGSRPSTADRDAAFLAFSLAGIASFRHLLDPVDSAGAGAVDSSRFAAVAVVAAFPSCGWTSTYGAFSSMTPSCVSS